MLDFTPVQNKEISWADFTANITIDQLRDLTNEMVDAMLAHIADCTDADVVFVPQDPNANDPYAADASEEAIAWTLGHVIVHTTASAEESAAVAAELARGVDVKGHRSRSERPWTSITRIDQCRQRLEESRRMRLASLEMWPDEPDLTNYVQFSEGGTQFTAVARFVIGLYHDQDHLGQIEEIVRQTKAAQST